MEVSKRWEYAKKLKLCFKCLGDGHQGQSCFPRILAAKRFINHRLIHKQAVNKNSAVNKNDSRKVPQQQIGCIVDKLKVYLSRKMLMLIKVLIQVKQRVFTADKKLMRMPQ